MNKVMDVGGERAGEGEKRREAERWVQSVAAGSGDGLGGLVVREIGLARRDMGPDEHGGGDHGGSDEEDGEEGDDKDTRAVAEGGGGWRWRRIIGGKVEGGGRSRVEGAGGVKLVVVVVDHG